MPRGFAILAVVMLAAAPSVAQVFGPAQLSAESKACIACHRDHSPGLYQQWGASKHFRAKVACFECHGASKNDSDAFEHYGQTIAILVTPKDCSRCHARQVEEFSASHHSKGARILGSIDNTLAEVVEGNKGMKSPAFPEGVAASAVNGCWQCHGSEVKVLPEGKLDPATWPNSGIGRINPDGSEGACNACHTRHTFSVAQARHPDTCGKCHLGPDHPQKEIYEESKHGINFFANINQMNLDSNKWIVGEDYWAAPTCATCHMSATRNQPVTHDVGLRISWNNRPELSVRPEVADAKMNLPGAAVNWETRRRNMQDVCINCHDAQWVANFYTQYDALIDLYNQKFAAPSRDLYALARKLLKGPQFSAEIDWVYYELWHHEGRRARHGASMMAPDYTHWHGTYEVAKRFYAEFVPLLEQLIQKHLADPDPARAAAAQDLKARLESVLASEDHAWFEGRMDPEEAARRQKALEDFKARYESTPARKTP